MIKRIPAILALAAPLLLLAGCDDEPEVSTEDDGREASGEVLEGTISDEMLPVDELRSQAPLVVESPAAAGGGAGDEATEDGNGETAEPAVETEPAPPVEAAEPRTEQP